MKFLLLTTLAVSAIPTLATPFAKANDITISITLADNPVPAACTANAGKHTHGLVPNHLTYSH